MAEWVAKCRGLVAPLFRAAPLRASAAGFLLSLLFSSTSAQTAPLGTACACAFYLAGYPAGALLGGLAGSALASHFPQTLVFLCMGICFCATKLLEKPARAQDKLLFLAGSWAFTLPFFYASSFHAFLTGLANLCLSLCAALCMRGALRAGGRMLKRRACSEGDLLCLAGSWAFAVYALCALPPLFGLLSWGAAFACLGLLLTATVRAVESAAIAVLMGAACVFGGMEASLCASLALCTLAGAAARRLGKWGVLSAFLAVALLLYGFVTPALNLYSAGAALLAYACIPRRLLVLLPGREEDAALRRAERQLARMEKRLEDTAEVLREAAPLFQSEDGFAQRQVLAVSSALARLCQPQPSPQRRYTLRIGAAALAKEGSRMTGDSMGMRRIRNQVVLLLSDGMGSGDEAHRESAAAVALLGDLLSIGFALSEALECVNRLLMQRAGESDMFATMDVLLFDLASGEAQFVKYGAPPSYILRGGKVLTLYAEALPAGIVKEARPALHVAPLKRGDTVVLMTDGAFEAFGSELARALLEKVGGANTADDAAQSLLHTAREKSGSDDMTVIVARIA